MMDDQEIERHLRIERANLGAPADARARAAVRLAAVIPGFSGPTGGGGGSGAAAPVAHANATAASIASAPLAAKVVTVALVAVGLGGTGLYVHRTQNDRAPTVHVDRSLPAVTTIASPTPVAQENGATESTPPPLTSALENAAPIVQPSAKADRGATLADERELLDRARGEINRDDPSTAMNDLDRHLSRYPQGRLSEEREALAIRALSRLGRGGEARERGARFKKRYPQSPLTLGVDHDLESIP